MLVSALKTLASFPFFLIWVLLLGALAWKRGWRGGPWVVWTAGLLLVVLSLPMSANVLMLTLQGEALDPETSQIDAQAIVVLSADYRPHAPEFGSAAVGALTLERLRYAAHLARQTGLPILTTGGVVASGSRSIALAMRRSLRRDFGLDARWIEEDSTTTWENAQNSAALLERDGIDSVALVTHAWHMPRAIYAFERAGLRVVAAPTAYRRPTQVQVRAFVPSAKALRECSWVIHEWLGTLWYRML